MMRDGALVLSFPNKYLKYHSIALAVIYFIMQINASAAKGTTWVVNARPITRILPKIYSFIFHFLDK